MALVFDHLHTDTIAAIATAPGLTLSAEGYDLRTGDGLVRAWEALREEKDDAKKEKLITQLIDLAKLSQNLLTGEKLSDFIKRSVDYIQ